MDFKDTPVEAIWRREVRDFLHKEMPAGLGDADGEGGLFGRGPAMQEWRKRVAAKGWIAPHWPKEYGGANMSAKDQFIMNEEFAEAEAPNVGGFGVMMIGPTLISHGSEEQKRRFLPSILKGETIWCQGYSEPGSGSDLASLQTRAVRDGDDYVINGQKIWTTGAQHADWMYMLARTDPDAPKHRGISMFLFDMKSPGVSVTAAHDDGGRPKLQRGLLRQRSCAGAAARWRGEPWLVRRRNIARLRAVRHRQRRGCTQATRAYACLRPK